MRVKPRKNRSEKLISLAPNSNRKSATFCIITLFFLYLVQSAPHFSPYKQASQTPHFSLFTFQFSVIKKGPVPTGTGPSPYIVRKLFNCINDCLKCLWLVECKVSQNLTVKSNTLSVHLANKL